VSGELSASYQNAKSAAEEVGGVYAVDTRTLSSGIGLLALKAQDFIKEGKPAKEILDRINDLAQHPQTSFMIYTMEYLYKGGRCSALKMIFATVLKIKPVLQLTDGKILVGRKHIGSYDKNIVKYVDETLEKYNTPDYARIFITHAGCAPDLIERVKERIKAVAPQFKEIHVTQAGSTITSHCGKGTLGILYINKQ